MARFDPYWTVAKFDSVTGNGDKVKKGDRIFYYPRTREVLVGEKAEQASRDFNAACFDEAQFNGTF
jgi:hypothetical protein